MAFSGHTDVQNAILLSCLNLRVLTIDLGLKGFKRARLGAFPAGWFEPQSAVEISVEEAIVICNLDSLVYLQGAGFGNDDFRIK